MMEKPKRKLDLAWQKVDDCVVMVELNQRRLFHSLNPVASLVWECCDGDHTYEQICGLITSKFEIDRPTAESDVRDFLNQLKKLELLEHE